MLHVVVGESAQVVTLLVDQQLALDTLEALPAETPDTVVAVSTERLPVEPLGLEDVTVDLVQLPRSSVDFDLSSL